MKPYFHHLLLALTLVVSGFAADKKIVLIAGPASHGPLEHEHRAGCLLLKKCLAGIPGVTSVVFDHGWPYIELNGKRADYHESLEDADAIIIYGDGGGNHPALQRDHLQVLGRLLKRGVGLGLIHYAVEPTIEKGQAEFIDWMGGAFEINWSVNPAWTPEFKPLPVHPVTRGVQPFTTKDEWYFNMRFRPGMKAIFPILTAVPPASTMSRPDGEHDGNPAVRAAVARGDEQHVMWLAERSDGGRGFGFTGGHYHLNWKNDDQRKLVLNALLWLAKVEVPAGGVNSTVTDDDLNANLDTKR